MERLYTYVAAALAAAALAGAGTWHVQEWRFGAKEAKRLLREREADDLRQADARQQRKFNDLAGGKHAAVVDALNRQLGDARARIALLSTTRQCLDAGTVRLLNDIGRPGGLGLRAAAGQPAGAAGAAAGSGNDGPGASERATADHIAVCRAGYARLSDQLNQILDVEARRDAARAGQ